MAVAAGDFAQRVDPKQSIATFRKGDMVMHMFDESLAVKLFSIMRSGVSESKADKTFATSVVDAPAVGMTTHTEAYSLTGSEAESQHTVSSKPYVNVTPTSCRSSQKKSSRTSSAHRRAQRTAATVVSKGDDIFEDYHDNNVNVVQKLRFEQYERYAGRLIAYVHQLRHELRQVRPAAEILQAQLPLPPPPHH